MKLHELDDRAKRWCRELDEADNRGEYDPEVLNKVLRETLEMIRDLIAEVARDRFF